MLRRFALVAMLIAADLFPQLAHAGQLDGLRLVAQDGTYLGMVSCGSIGNPYSIYGSRYGVHSIWNKFSLYGNEYGVYSPWNPYSVKPPILINGNDDVAYVTTNRYKNPSISPIELESYLIDECDLSTALRE